MKNEQNNHNLDSENFEILDNFERFDQKNDVFRRSWWDQKIKSKKTELFYSTYREPLKTWKKADGFTQKDYALRNAAWHVSDILTEINVDQDRREGFQMHFLFKLLLQKTKFILELKMKQAKKLKRFQKLLVLAS